MPSPLDVFPFHLALDPVPFETYRPAQRRVSSARSGKRFVLVAGDQLEYYLKAEVALPQPVSSGLDISDFLSFVDDHKAMEFLVMPFTGNLLRRETTSFTATASQTDFPFYHKYLRADTLAVTKNGTPVSASLVDNNTAPLARLAVGAGGGDTVVITALFYVPAVFLTNPAEVGAGLAEDSYVHADGPRSFEIVMVETEPGARFVSPTTAPGGA